MGSPASNGSFVTVKRKRVAYLALATAGLLVLGLVYAWSIFATPIAVQYGWDKGSLQLVFNIAMICFCVAALLGSYVMKVLPLKGALAIAATMIALGFLGTAFFASKSLVGMYFSYGLLCGAGCGMGYNLVIAAVNSWFPDKIGFSSGVMMMGMGLGSLLLGSAADSLIGIVGIELGFIVLAVVAFAVVIALSTVLKPAPADAASLLARSSSGPHASNDGLCDCAPLKDPLFYVYMIWAIFTIAVGITLIGGVKQGALVLGVDGAVCDPRRWALLYDERCEPSCNWRALRQVRALGLDFYFWLADYHLCNCHYVFVCEQHRCCLYCSFALCRIWVWIDSRYRLSLCERMLRGEGLRTQFCDNQHGCCNRVVSQHRADFHG